MSRAVCMGKCSKCLRQYKGAGRIIFRKCLFPLWARFSCVERTGADSMTNIMDERAAWRDFYDQVRPVIWAGLSRKDRRDVNTAERDFYERRRDGRTGKLIKLGPERVARLLERLAPGVYVIEKTVSFRRV